MPKFHKLQRGVCLALFLSSSIVSYFNPHMILIAGLSLIGVVAYDVVCYLKEKSKPKDFGPEMEDLRGKLEQTVLHVQEMKNDVSVAKLSNSFRSR
jgi:hypothetical protein